MLLFSCAFPLINKADVLLPFCLLFLISFLSVVPAPLTKTPKGKGMIGHPGRRGIIVKLLWGTNKEFLGENYFSNGIPKLKVNQMVKKNTSHLEQKPLSF